MLLIEHEIVASDINAPNVVIKVISRNNRKKITKILIQILLRLFINISRSKDLWSRVQQCESKFL